ncbi:hypothetical protein [Nostoc sp. FACHB-190]|uniref:hypothetical protein n=1 Tax=Nostoc sp. FACHB-190 TaxID=2692838 RepID=UPI001686D955|nr:hypothetical protein [Nostoc sp. FACHB-190]MBD2303487.1 hypothetical protein [Nostoc sp. FACHB-190]
MQIFSGNLMAQIRKAKNYPDDTHIVEIRFLDNPTFDLGHDYVGSFQDCISNAATSFKDLSKLANC